MKRILITGKNSYIGTSVEKWLLKEPENYTVDTLDVKDESWKQHDFSQYDVVFHVAGIAHVKETKKNRPLYFKVNRDLAFEVARKAKDCNVIQFIFLSSMSVYGLETGVISKDTVPNPKSSYGKSKLEAEMLIKKLQDELFRVAIIRPPMVYGKGCKGNYQKLSKLSKITPIFPLVENKRSMIYVDNLSEYVKELITKEFEGNFYPQNNEYVNTSEMVRIICEVNGRRILFSKLLGMFVSILDFDFFIKIFQDLIYEYNEIDFKLQYNQKNFYQSISESEGRSE